jgi:hypothetical protein
VVVLAFGVIFGLVKLQTEKTPTTEQPVAQVQPATPSVVPTVQDNGPREVNKADKNTAVAYQPVTPKKNTPVNFQKNTVASRSVTPKSVTPKSVTPKSEILAAHPVKLLPGERAYLQTIARLDSTIKANQRAMRPSLQVEYERNLAVVDRAIAATRSAAKKNPTDPDTTDFMFAAYQSKVDLLNTIADARVGGGRSH